MNTNTPTKEVALSEVCWFDEDNIARGAGGMFRDEKDEHNLISLLADGWDSQLGRPAVRELTDEERKEAKSRLETRWASLRNADLSADAEKIRVDGETVSITIPEMLQVFEQVHVRNSKLVVPKYKGATCFRRGNVLLKVNTIRAKRKQETITTLPCVQREYENAMEQYIDNIRENQLKTAGARKMSNADSVGAARRLFQLGATESKLSKAFGLKRGMAQKFHRLCQLDAKHEGLGIVDGILSGEISDKVFDKEKVKGLLDKNATSEEVATFIQNPGAGNLPKIMARKDIEALYEQSPVDIVKVVLQAILKNDVNILAPFVAKAKAINGAVETVLKG